MRSGGLRKRDCRQGQAIKPLVGAGGLDVAGLLALVADTVVADLSGAVAGKVTDLTTYCRVSWCYNREYLG